MAIILSENDLKQLYQTAPAMDELLNLIEDSLRAHSRDQVAGQSEWKRAWSIRNENIAS
jgi:hypothetical protein